MPALPRLPAPDLPPAIAAAMPFRRYRVAIGERLVHVVDHGDGPLVLLVHGNPTWSFLWRKVIRRLTGFRVIAPDLLGFGLSDKPRRPSAHTVDAHVAVLSALVDAIGGDGWTVAGQDWGGPLGCGVARHLAGQGRLGGLVLANTAVLPARRPVRATAFHRVSHLPGLAEALFYGARFPIGVLSRVQGRPDSIGAFERDAYALPFARWGDRAGPLGLARMVPHRDDHPSLPTLDAIGRWAEGHDGPRALVWGARDPILGRALGRLQAAWPGVPATVTDAGHFLQEEVPDAIADAIRGVAGPIRAAARGVVGVDPTNVEHT